jgi:hypothetical protein
MVVVSCWATQFIYPPYPPLFAAIIYSSGRRLCVTIPEHKKGRILLANPLETISTTKSCPAGASDLRPKGA